MYYILYQEDHANRAKALDGNIPNRQLVEDPVKNIPGLTTLVFWGHGTSGFLCNLTPSELAKKVKEWKEINKGINTIEILTCNSRHAQTGSDPFVESFKQKLGFFQRRKLTIKSLPVRMGQGGVKGDSILFADYKSKTWCYMTATVETFMFMKNVFKAVCEDDFNDDAIKAAVYLTSSPITDIQSRTDEVENMGAFLKKCKVASVKEIHDSKLVHGWSHNERFMIDFRAALKNNSFRRAFVTSRTYTMNYGMFDTLRKSLVTI